MDNFTISGSWFSQFMVILFFLLPFTALLNLFGIANTVAAEVHKIAGIIFCVAFLLHLAATGRHYRLGSKKKLEPGSTLYQNLNRQHSL